MAKPSVYRHDGAMFKCGSNRGKKDGHSRGKRQCKCNQCGKKRQEGAKHRFTDEHERASGEDARGGDELVGNRPRDGRERNRGKRVGQKRGRWRESV